MGCGPPEEAGSRKANQLEGGTSSKTSQRCVLPSWGLKDDEELPREREDADFQVGRRTRAGTPRFET